MGKAPSQTRKPNAERLLSVPAKAGRAIIESGALIACPLLGTDRFVKFCKERGLAINRERLLHLEHLGMFAPVFRVRTPKRDVPPFYLPIRGGTNWFTKRWAYDTTGVPQTHHVPDHQDRTQEGYYSIFQIDYLALVLCELTLHVQLDGYLEPDNQKSVAWQENGERWMQYARDCAESLREHEYRRAVALLCQHVSNRYYPQTQGDLRAIKIHKGHSSDRWISVVAHDWDWEEDARSWNAGQTERLYKLTPEKLRHAYEGLSVTQEHCDPLANWYQLTQFISLRERARLKGDALRAETLRAGAHMLRLLHKDLYGEDLPHPNEVTGTIITHFPELEVRADVRRYLEFVVNRFGLNPQPRLALIVEGQSEEAAVVQIFEQYYGAHPGVYGIEIIMLGGVGAATGRKKEDRFRAIFRLIDYLHHHQTITFLILDNENYAAKLKDAAKEAKSIHSEARFVTRPDYIRIWKDSLEFDNFSCTEIAAAMNEAAQGYATFTVREVTTVKAQANSGAGLARLYRQKSGYGLEKIKLNEILVCNMLSPLAKRDVESRPLIKTLNKVERLAARNPLPTTQKTWEINQASKHLGKKRKPAKTKKASRKTS